MAGLSMEELLKYVYDSADTVWIIELEGERVTIIRDVMTPSLEGTSLDFAELSGKYLNGCIYSPDVKVWEEYLSTQALRDFASSGDEKRVFDIRFQSDKFGFEWQEATMDLLKDSEGKPDRILLTGRNVNEKRKTQIVHEAVSNEYDYVLYIEADKNNYVMYNSNSKSGTPIPSASSADYDREVFEFHKKYVPQDEQESLNERMRIAYVRPILDQEGEYITYCRIIENGELREKKLRYSFYDRDKQIWLLTRTDITEIKEERRQKELMKDALNSATVANRAKAEFLSRMSHDIRTPMNAIIGMTAIAGAHIHDPERVVDCLGKITMSSRLLLSLINEVLDMSKIESGKIVLSEDEFELPDLLQSIVTMIQPAIEARNQIFDIHITDVNHEMVIGDMQRLEQVLLNLLSNAAKYTPEGGRILFEIHEKPSGHFKEACYEFSVSDNGIGMRPEFLDKIFQPFERADDENIRMIQGTGLGMAISKNIVEMMDGDITVESEYGVGSRFVTTVFLRVQEPDYPHVGALQNLKVLVVDDDEAVCKTTCQNLQSIGMAPQWTLNGKDAVQKTVSAFKSGDIFFALIIDLKMPGMDGIETTRQIRAQVGRDVPIIMISAYEWSAYEQEALKAGVDAFIMKPLFRSRLLCKLKQFVTREPTVLPESQPLYRAKSFEGKRILLVEDNELNREIAHELISCTGASVEWAENGLVAVERMSSVPEGYFDMIFMDMQMPVMGGCEAAAAIRALHRLDASEIPIVAMTANAFAEDIDKTKAAGMNEHLSKPIDTERLYKTMEEWLY